MTSPPSNDSTQNGESAFPHWRQNRTALTASAFLSGISFHLSFPYLPLMLLNLGVVDQLDRWIGYLMLVFYAAGIIANPLWGGLADHFGRKMMVLRATFGMGLSMLAIALAWSPLSFGMMLIICGIFNGSMPAVNSLVVAATPRNHLGAALSQVQTGNLLGRTLGPAAGIGIAAIVASYQSMYWISGALQLTAGLLVLAFVREVQRPAAGAWRPHLIGDLAGLMKVPGIPALMLLSFVCSMLMAGNVIVLSLHVVNLLAAKPASFGDQSFWIGAVAIAVPVSGIVALPFWGSVLDRKGPRLVLVLSTIAAALMHVPLVFVDTPFQIVLARIAFGLSAIAMQPALTWLLREASPKGMDARAISYATSIQFLAMGLAPFIAGLMAPVFGLPTYFGLTVAITVGSLIIWLAVPGSRAGR